MTHEFTQVNMIHAFPCMHIIYSHVQIDYNVANKHN